MLFSILFPISLFSKRNSIFHLPKKKKRKMSCLHSTAVKAVALDATAEIAQIAAHSVKFHMGETTKLLATHRVVLPSGDSLFTDAGKALLEVVKTELLPMGLKFVETAVASI